MRIENIKQLREKKGVSQRVCASETGIPIRTLQRYESGENIGDPAYLFILMEYFGLQREDIIQDIIQKEKK